MQTPCHTMNKAIAMNEESLLTEHPCLDPSLDTRCRAGVGGAPSPEGAWLRDVVANAETGAIVPALGRKRALYAKIREALAPGGVFLSADANMHEAAWESARSAIGPPARRAPSSGGRSRGAVSGYAAKAEPKSSTRGVAVAAARRTRT